MDISSKTADFIEKFRHEDVRRLAFLGDRYPDVDLPWALQQIAGWQTACRKLPSWAATKGLVYPSHLSMEQCSSEFTARYKRQVLESVVSPLQGEQVDGGWQLIDLTGGFGVDFSFMAPLFHQSVYVEKQPSLCQLAQHNFPLLGLDCFEVICDDCESYLSAMSPCEQRVVFLDPARRDSHGARTYAVADCTPDVLRLREPLLEKCDWLLLKFSPMLDWHKAVADLEAGDDADGQHVVRQIHIVSVQNECKELLLLLSRKHRGGQQVFCVNDDVKFIFKPDDDATPPPVSPTFFDKDGLFLDSFTEERPAIFLYEPNASIMKAGCFSLLQQRFNIAPIGVNSHLFISPDEIDDFPGRRFVVETVASMNKKALKTALAGVKNANITVRNFPLSVAELRKRLKLGDGGETYIFATTYGQREHLLFVCRKP